MAAFSTAWATKPTPTPPTPSGGGSEATAGAVAVGVGVGIGQGGQGGSGLGVGLGGEGGHGGKGGAGGVGVGGLGQGGSVGNTDIDASSGHTFVAPAPVTTVVPVSNGGIVTKSHAVGLGWNLISWSKSEQGTDPFVAAERMIVKYEQACQFETASILRQRQYALVDPSFRELPAQPGVRNYTFDECAKMRSVK